MEHILAYIDGLEEPFRTYVSLLHDKVMGLGPEFTVRLAWGVPFYYLRKRVLYLNPDGKDMIVGFCHGNLLTDPSGCLKGLDRKEIRHYIIRSVGDIDDPELDAMLYEAIELDEQLHGHTDRNRLR